MNKDNVKNRIPCWVVGEYYTPSLREMAKGIKAGDMTAIRMAAREMASLIPAGAVLVPILPIRVRRYRHVRWLKNWQF